MKKQILKSIAYLLGIVFTLCYSANAISQETKTTSATPKADIRQIKYFYVHGLGTMSFDIYKSSDINALFTNGMKINTVGFPFQYGVRAGFKNIAQLEYHASSTSAHNIGTVTGYVNGQWVGTSVPMKLKASDIILKINPLFWSWSNQNNGIPAKCLFAMIGNGNVTYKDKINEGFEGSGMILGLEFAIINKLASYSVGMTIHQITYDKARLFNTNFTSDLKASRFTLYTSLGLGYGI